MLFRLKKIEILSQGQKQEFLPRNAGFSPAAGKGMPNWESWAVPAIRCFANDKNCRQNYIDFSWKFTEDSPQERETA